MTRRLSDYVCATCYSELVPHPAGWSCDYHGVGVKRRSKAWLARQRENAERALNAPPAKLPPLPVSMAVMTERLYGKDVYD